MQSCKSIAVLDAGILGRMQVVGEVAKKSYKVFLVTLECTTAPKMHNKMTSEKRHNQSNPAKTKIRENPIVRATAMGTQQQHPQR